MDRDTMLKDTKNHVLEIIRDDNLLRYLIWREPESSVNRVDITTWPGHLCISGDMGCYVFERNADMFEFFAGSVGNDINPEYWAQKCIAHDKHAPCMVFSADEFRDCVMDYIDAELEDDIWTTEEEAELDIDIVQELRLLTEASEEEYFKWAGDYSFVTSTGKAFDFRDSWEWDCKAPHARYLWCCYAIQEVIRLYRLNKKEGKGA